MNIGLKFLNFILEVRGKHDTFLRKGSDLIKVVFGGRAQWHQYRRWAQTEARTPVSRREQHLSA